MFHTRQPSDQVVQRFIASQCDLPFSYPDVGATQTQPPAGYNVDLNRIKLGAGKFAFEKAVAALRNWKHFDLGWVRVVPAKVPIEVGATVVVQARTLGLWSLNACRIVYVLEGSDGDLKARFGFAYGTLPDHVERGEERFLIERLNDDSVWYDILAFSRPHHPLAKVASPYARRLQKRFAKDSLAAMLKAVSA